MNEYMNAVSKLRGKAKSKKMNAAKKSKKMEKESKEKC